MQYFTAKPFVTNILAGQARRPELTVPRDFSQFDPYYPQSGLASFRTAHSALSATTSSSSLLSFSSSGRNFLSPLLPIAITEFRRMPERFARRTGEPRNALRNSSSLISATQSSAGFTNSARGWNSAALVAGA